MCGSPGPEGALSVESWELRQITGMQAYLGTVHQAREEILLHPGNGRPLIPLDDVPDELRRSVASPRWQASGETSSSRYARSESCLIRNIQVCPVVRPEPRALPPGATSPARSLKVQLHEQERFGAKIRPARGIPQERGSAQPDDAADRRYPLAGSVNAPLGCPEGRWRLWWLRGDSRCEATSLLTTRGVSSSPRCTLTHL